MGNSLIASQSKQEWRDRTDKSIFILLQDFLKEKRTVELLLKRAEWAEKQKIEGFASIPSPNRFGLGWILAGTLKSEKLFKEFYTLIYRYCVQA